MDGIDEKRYLISIDGGGTNTGVCIYDRLQDISRTKIIGGGNYKTHGIEIVRKRIQTCLQNMLPEIDDIPASTLFLVMGLSGCDSQRDLDIYAEMMQELGFLPEQMMICNDSEMIFRAVTDAPGICTIAGTGTIALAFGEDGEVWRAGGWGAPISDQGSGYWIGAQITGKYLDWIDGIGPYNEFFPRFREALNCGADEEAAALLAAMSPAEIADWARPVFEAASENSLCMEIVRSAADKAAALTASVWKKAGFTGEDRLFIVESGSLFKNELYENGFRDALLSLLPDAVYQFLRSDGLPAEDGIRLARKIADDLVTTQSED